MSRCNDVWCEHYGKGNAKCGHCEKQESARDKPGLRAILKRRAVEQMKLDKGPISKKNQGQSR